ncbi:hypothetical protein HLA86_04230 [Staphylococcus caprae]|uniref:hypothetical protein n=1 Tax=Staphylococcus caprae TaxID=29380 RepID=UPI001C8311AE|nr:hypothetical protein [Staphylococcus caprae]MBX5318804.1 hypothetical protein [Staphylococcus caprae]
MKKVTLLSSAVLAGTIALSGVTGVANASEYYHGNTATYKEKVESLTKLKKDGAISNKEFNTKMGYLKKFDKHGRTDMGARPYAGIAPRGMTSKQYSELEYNVGNANEMPDSVFNKRVDKETQKIANKYGNTIYAPQKTYKPKSTQTHQGNRPYAGISPKGMTEAPYAELEKNIGDASKMSKKVFEKKVNKETQKIADKYNTTIYAPQKTFKPHK